MTRYASPLQASFFSRVCESLFVCLFVDLNEVLNEIVSSVFLFSQQLMRRKELSQTN